MRPHDYEYMKAMADPPAGRRAPHPFQVPRLPEHPYLGAPTAKDYQRKVDRIGAVLLVLLVIIAVGLLIAAIGKLMWAVIPWLA